MVRLGISRCHTPSAAVCCFLCKICLPILCFENNRLIGNSPCKIATKGLVCSGSSCHDISDDFHPLLVRFKMRFQLEKHLNVDTAVHWLPLNMLIY